MSLICPLPSGETLHGFRLALEEDGIADRIRTHLLAHGDLIRCTPVYVRYKELDGTLIGFRVITECGGEQIESYVTVRCAPRWRLRTEADRLANRVGEERSGLRCVALLEEDEMLLISFPVDRILPDLRRMLRPSKVRGLVLGSFPEFVPEGLRLSKRRSDVTLMSYKPERRAVLRWQLAMVDQRNKVQDRKGIFLRIHDEGRAPRVAQALQMAHAAGVRCPRPMAAPHPRLAVESQVPGACSTDPEAADFEAAGALLARLHEARPPTSLPKRRAIDELDAVMRTCHSLGRLDVELGQRAEAIGDCLSRWIPPAPPPALVHGDFHLQQLVFDHGVPGLVDFDRAALGSPAHDLANFHAHLLEKDPAWTGKAIEALASGYRGHRALPATDELDWHTVCAMVRCAAAPFRTLATDWPQRVGSLLDQAARWAERLPA